eukprot:4401382-Amphidinium_carterae.1
MQLNSSTIEFHVQALLHSLVAVAPQSIAISASIIPVRGTLSDGFNRNVLPCHKRMPAPIQYPNKNCEHLQIDANGHILRLRTLGSTPK